MIVFTLHRQDEDRARIGGEGEGVGVRTERGVEEGRERIVPGKT